MLKREGPCLSQTGGRAGHGSVMTFAEEKTHVDSTLLSPLAHLIEVQVFQRDWSVRFGGHLVQGVSLSCPCRQPLGGY